tara:strand:+ start:1513 stop:1752 length:240 start_codon:yes stop_codon:yes gene_type:complete
MDDEDEFETARRDTMTDLHKSEIMYSVIEKPIDINDFKWEKAIKEGTFGTIWKASLSGSNTFYVVKNFEKQKLVEHGYV